MNRLHQLNNLKDINLEQNEFENQQLESIQDDEKSEEMERSIITSNSQIKSEQQSQRDSEETKNKQIILKQANYLEKKLSFRQQNLEEIVRAYHQQRKQGSRFNSKILHHPLSSNNLVNEKKTKQQQLLKRIHQLNVAKIVVNIYDKSDFRLVLAHYHLGQSYLKNQRLDMSLQHISIAIHKNQKLFNEIPKARLIHIYMQNVKAQILMLKESYLDARQILLSIFNSKVNDGQCEAINKSMILLAKCLSKLGLVNEALEKINEAIICIQEDKNDIYSYSLAFAFVEKALILADDLKFPDAVEAQQTAIRYLIDKNYSKPEQVVKMHQVLAKYYELGGNPENALFAMQKVRTLCQELYTQQNHQVIKARRKIAIALLKSKRFKEAVNQLMEIVQIQLKFYGESSLQAARTLKLLGIVYKSLEANNARIYLNRALKIFTKNGIHKQVAQIKNIISSLNSINNSRMIDIFPHSEQQI